MHEEEKEEEEEDEEEEEEEEEENKKEKKNPAEHKRKDETSPCYGHYGCLGIGAYGHTDGRMDRP